MFQAVILGLIQGLTEFLPISSSGHLILIPELVGWEPSGLTFDVALNTGTFLAVVIYFFPRWWGLLTKGVFGGQKQERALLGYLVLATIPAALIGYFLEPLIESTLRQPVIAASMLILFGLLLHWAEKQATLTRNLEDIKWGDALKVGLAQSLALIPGVSRSGITITTGLSLGLKKEEAAEFSFLLLAPISLGAAILHAPDVMQATNALEMALGALVSFAVGIVAIHVLLRLIKRYGFAPYVWYRVALGVVALLWIFIR